MRRLITCAAAAATFAAILPAGITAAADTPPEAPEGYLAYYSFDGTAAENEKLTVIKPDSWQGTDPATGADTESEAIYSDRKARYGKSLDLSDGRMADCTPKW